MAEIKLRHLNREYILKRIAEVESLSGEIAEMQDILGDPKKIRRIITEELKAVKEKYGQPRRTQFLYADQLEEEPEEDETPDYPVHLFCSASGYFKKITPQSLRVSGEQKLKEGDTMAAQFEATNRTELLFFTDRCQVYKSRASAFDDTKASLLGDYVPAKLGFDENESLVKMIPTVDYSGFVLFAFENGKIAKVPLSAYATKTNRKRLANAYSGKSRLVEILYCPEDTALLVRTTNNRALLFHTAMILPKATRDTIGVQVVTLKAKAVLDNVVPVDPEQLEQLKKYSVKNIPTAGVLAKDLPDSHQLSFPEA